MPDERQMTGARSQASVSTAEPWAVPNGLRIAVLLPCYNEAVAIAQVVRDFQTVLPMAEVYVFDNASSDTTADVARAAGAQVRFESRKGKGNVVRRMFADVEADLYLMADGDGTYDAASAERLVQLALEGPFDMVVGTREDIGSVSRSGHAFGNRLFNGLLRLIFGNGFNDIFSGYRVFSRRFVKSFPAEAEGFETETETEMSVFALEQNIPVKEVPMPYRERIAGSESKLRTFHDGFRILAKMIFLMKDVRPLLFFSIIGGAFFLLSLGLGIPVIVDYFATGLVPRFPTAILASALGILGFISLTCGVVLDGVARQRRQLKRLAFLAAGPTLSNVQSGRE